MPMSTKEQHDWLEREIYDLKNPPSALKIAYRNVRKHTPDLSHFDRLPLYGQILKTNSDAFKKFFNDTLLGFSEAGRKQLERMRISEQIQKKFSFSESNASKFADIIVGAKNQEKHDLDEQLVRDFELSYSDPDAYSVKKAQDRFDDPIHRDRIAMAIYAAKQKRQDESYRDALLEATDPSRLKIERLAEQFGDYRRARNLVGIDQYKEYSDDKLRLTDEREWSIRRLQSRYGTRARAEEIYNLQHQRHLDDNTKGLGNLNKILIKLLRNPVVTAFGAFGIAAQRAASLTDESVSKSKTIFDFERHGELYRFGGNRDLLRNLGSLYEGLGGDRKEFYGFAKQEMDWLAGLRFGQGVDRFEKFSRAGINTSGFRPDMDPLAFMTSVGSQLSAMTTVQKRGVMASLGWSPLQIDMMERMSRGMDESFYSGMTEDQKRRARRGSAYSEIGRDIDNMFAKGGVFNYVVGGVSWLASRAAMFLRDSGFDGGAMFTGPYLDQNTGKYYDVGGVEININGSGLDEEQLTRAGTNMIVEAIESVSQNQEASR